MIALFVQLVLALIVFHPAPVGGGASVSPRRTSAGTCPRGQRFGKDRRWAVRLKATAPGITASLGAVASQGLGKGSPQGSLIAADSKNVWNLVLNAPASITEAAGVNVSQGNLTGTLVNALQNAWTLDINSTAAYSTFTEVVQLSGPPQLDRDPGQRHIGADTARRERYHQHGRVSRNSRRTREKCHRRCERRFG